MIYNNITETIGRTPIVKLRKLNEGLGAEIFLKLEFFNPLGSVKDRIGLAMIEDAEKSGALKRGMQVIEPTSGNTGIALAFVCSAKGYPLTLVMPETMSLERRTLLLLLGAKVVLTPGPLGMKGAIAKANELASKDPTFYLTKQFENPANPRIHEITTSEEIWKDMQGRVDVLVAGVGTGGTISGVGRVLKKRNPDLKVFAVEPEESAVISGAAPGPHKIQGIGAGFVPKNLDLSVLDGIEKVTSAEAVQMAKRLIREEGIPVGISSGAAMVAASRIAARPEFKGKRLIVILASYTERYLSTVLAQEELNEARMLPTETIDPKWLN